MKSTTLTASRSRTLSGDVPSRKGDGRQRRSDDDVEDLLSKETLDRRKDRKLRDDVTKMMYRLEMDNIKPSFDVMLSAGVHRGLFHRNFRRRRCPLLSSTSVHEGLDSVEPEQDSGRRRARGDRHSKEVEFPRQHVGIARDKHSRPSRWSTDFDDKSLARLDHALADLRAWSPVSAAPPSAAKRRETLSQASDTNYDDQDSFGRLSSLVLRASQHYDRDLDSSAAATLPRSWPRHNPRAAVISVEELPTPHRGTYYVTTTQDVDDGPSSAVEWQHKTSSVKNGPQRNVSVDVVPIDLRDDDLVSLLRESEVNDDELSLDYILAHRSNRSVSSPYRSTVPTNNSTLPAVSSFVDYNPDDDHSQLQRLLDNPFGRPNFDGGVRYGRMPYTPATIVTHPSWSYD